MPDQTPHPTAICACGHPVGSHAYHRTVCFGVTKQPGQPAQNCTCKEVRPA